VVKAKILALVSWSQNQNPSLSLKHLSAIANADTVTFYSNSYTFDLGNDLDLVTFSLNLSVILMASASWFWFSVASSSNVWPRLTPLLSQYQIRHNHGSCPFLKIKFKDFSRIFKDHMKNISSKTELNQTGTFIIIYKQVRFTFKKSVSNSNDRTSYSTAYMG